MNIEQFNKLNIGDTVYIVVMDNQISTYHAAKVIKFFSRSYVTLVLDNGNNETRHKAHLFESYEHIVKHVLNNNKLSYQSNQSIVKRMQNELKKVKRQQRQLSFLINKAKEDLRCIKQ